MIQIALASFLVWLFFKIMEKDSPLEGFAAFTLVIAPALLMLLVSAGVGLLKLPEYVKHMFEVSYFVIPFFIIKGILQTTNKKAAAYAAVVFGIVLFSYVPLYLVEQYV